MFLFHRPGLGGLCAALLFLPVVLLALLIGYSIYRDEIPQLPENLRFLRQQPPTEILSSDGEVLRYVGNRSYVPLDQISRHFLKAIVAAEDSRFFSHHGIDPVSIARAVWINLQRNGSIQGGSTLTQQLAKNLFLSFEKSYSRKFRELLLAIQIESTFSKEEILEAYCNQVYFGEGAWGVEDASQRYFGKPARNLTLLQSAVLAAIPKAPSHYNPVASLERANRRAVYVLNRMEIDGGITREQKMEALKSELELSRKEQKPDPNGYFVDFILDRLEQELGAEVLTFGSLRVTTTLNATMQRHAHEAARRHLKFLKEHGEHSGKEDPLEAAVVALDNHTGAVRVMLGGVDSTRSRFNRALSNNRMPGSSFKPLVYMSALEHLGYHPETVVVDEPILLQIPGTSPWQPRNFNDVYYGPIALKAALARSLNSVAVQLVYRLTPSRVISTARKFGITSPLPPNYSLALGTSGLSPLELAAAYSVIANLGVYHEPFFISRIEDLGGKRLFEHFVHPDRRFSASVTYQLLDMMQGVVENGSGRVVRRLGFHHPAGGKTGTTNDFRDAWFTGFTRQFTTSVWVGHDSNQPLRGPNGKGLTGSHASAPIWAYLMKVMHEDLPTEPFSNLPKVQTERWAH